MIYLTKFAQRHWQSDFKGTRILVRQAEFLKMINSLQDSGYVMLNGDLPYIKHMLFRTSGCVATSGVAEITPENKHLLCSGYAVRREGELAYLARWFEGMEAPIAKHLHIVVYGREHLLQQGEDGEGDFGIVSIAGALTPGMQPRSPETIMRNALGLEFGGNGKPIDVEEYKQGIEFWNKYALIR